MFEDGPPPLPPISTVEVSSDGAFADLSDENRLTAVADDHYDASNAECNIDIPDRYPGESVEELPEHVDPQLEYPAKEYSRLAKAAEDPEIADNNADPECSICSNFPEITIPSSSSSHTAQFSKPCDTVPQFPDFANSGFVGATDSHNSVQATSTPINNNEHKTNDESKKEIHEETKIICDRVSGDENFADIEFNDAVTQKSMSGNAAEGNSMDVDDEEFGDFEGFVGAVQSDDCENADDWADFETAAVQDFDVQKELPAAPSPSKAESTAQIVSSFDESPLPGLNENLCDDHLWIADSADDARIDDQAIPQCGIYETLSRAATMNEDMRPAETMWLAVSIIEEALALKLQWQESSIRNSFLDSLDIDANKVAIRNSGLPVFAQHLEESTVLEPISAGHHTTVISAMKKNSSPQSSSAEFLPRTNMEKSTNGQQPIPRAVTVDSLAVPPVQFDWNNSGLTNPLKAGSISACSAILDLDFLATANSKTGMSGEELSNMQVYSTLQKDLVAFGLSLPDDAVGNKVQKESTNKQPIIMDCLMKRKSNEERKYTPVSELSLDARALHDQLPDLDYMLSNVLLFPVINR